MLLHHVEWTNDLDFAKEMFDTVRRVLDYEARVFDPDRDGLYRNQLNTWVSDSHWYNGGGCAQASAYNYRANDCMTRIARKLGKDPAPFAARAAKIKRAMQETLWLPQKGVMAEYIDTVGRRLIHPSPELATIYHSIECDTVDAFQAYQMLRFTETDLRNDCTLARKGRLVWSSNWYPQHFTSCGLYSDENLGLALACFQNGQATKGMDILNGLVDAHFLGKTPGAVGHCMTSSGYNGGAIDFADIVSMHLRLIVEGLFGVRFKLLNERVEIAPNLPRDWSYAELRTKDISLGYHREDNEENLTIYCERPAQRVVRLPLRSTRLKAVQVNGLPVKYQIEPEINRCSVVVEADQTGTLYVFLIHDDGTPPGLRLPESVQEGDGIRIESTKGRVVEYKDPSGTLAGVAVDGGTLQAKAVGGPGAHTVFVRVNADQWDGWLAADFVVPPKPRPQRAEPKGRFVPIDISTHFNISLAEIHSLKYRSPRGADGVGENGRSRWDDGNHGGPYKVIVKDQALRECQGKFRTLSGIDFLTPPTGPNAACVSIWDNFPREIMVPLAGRATELAVLFIGVTNPMQARVENARFVVRYADESTEEAALINPDNFDDWLDPAVQRQNETVYFSDYNHAIVQRILLDPTKELKGLTVQAVANEVILGVLGVSLRME
jgi:hypothetical protein